MRRGLAKTVLIAGLALGLISHSLKSQTKPGTLLNVPLAEVIAREQEQEPILIYTFMKMKRDGREKKVGEAYIREHSIEAKLLSIYNISFVQPNDSTYIEEVNIPVFLGAWKESYVYAKDSLWKFVGRKGSLFYDHPEKDKFLNAHYPVKAMTQPELFKALLMGDLPDTSLTFVMGELYRLPKIADNKWGDERCVRLDFLDLKKEKNDVTYIDDPVSSYFNKHNLPYEADIIMTDVNYKRGVRHETKIPAKLILEYVDTTRFKEVYGRQEMLTEQQDP